MSIVSMKRNGAIDILRVVFAGVILLKHARGLGGGGPLCAKAGYIAVEFFYLVAGYLMAASAERAAMTDTKADLGVETIRFVWRKIKRLLPAYVFAVLFSFARIVVVNRMSLFAAIRTLGLGMWDILFLRASGIKTYGIVRGSWFLSAMYIAMLILYPLLRKYKRRFICILAPLISITLLGWLSQKHGNLNQYVNEYALLYSGVLRAIAELSMGCICFAAAKRINALRLTKLSKWCLSGAQVVGYAAVIVCTTKLPVEQFDFVLLLVLAVCVTLTFSAQGALAGKFATPGGGGTGDPAIGKAQHGAVSEPYVGKRNPCCFASQSVWILEIAGDLFGGSASDQLYLLVMGEGSAAALGALGEADKELVRHF